MTSRIGIRNHCNEPEEKQKTPSQGCRARAPRGRHHHHHHHHHDYDYEHEYDDAAADDDAGRRHDAEDRPQRGRGELRLVLGRLLAAASTAQFLKRIPELLANKTQVQAPV